MDEVVRERQTAPSAEMTPRSAELMGVEVRESPMGGVGVFALRPFKIGEVVLRWDIAHRIRRLDVPSLSPEEQHFLVPFDQEWVILMQPPARYVNHSCASNTLPQGFCDVAVRSIAAGEEVTSNYLATNETLSFVCHCGAPNCVSQAAGR
jgi:hypothetical protein